MELVKEKKGGIYNSGKAHGTFASDDCLRKRARDRSGKPEAGGLCVRRTCNGKPGGLAFRLAMPHRYMLLTLILMVLQTTVFASDGLNYAHRPLARTELGAYRVQGQDFFIV